MTAVVQTVAVNGLAGVSAKTVTISASQPGNSIVVTLAIEGGSTRYTSVTVTDDKSNTYLSTETTLPGGNQHTAGIFYCLAPTSGVTSVTITPSGGSGGMYGALAVQEVSGITALDKHVTGNAAGASPLTLTNPSVNTGTADFVTSAISLGNGSSNVGLSNPPTGYTISAIEQNDSTDAGGACAYRIDTSAVTDSITWAATGWEPVDPAALASFVGSASTGTTIAPNAGGLSVSGQTPTVTRSGSTTIIPSAGSATLTGATPTRLTSGVIAPAAAALTLVGIASLQTLQVLPPSAGSLAIAGQSPTITASSVTVRTPTAGNLAIASSAPILVSSRTIAPTVGTVSASGQTPPILFGSIQIPVAGGLSVSGSSPTTPGNLIPATSSMTLTGNAPVMQVAFTISPNAAALGFVGFPSQSGNAAFIAPAAGSLSLNGLNAVLTRSGSIIPSTGGIGIAGIAPQLGGQIVITPAAGTASFGGLSALLTRTTLLSPVSGALSFAGNFPVLGGQIVLAPSTGGVSLNGQSPALGGSFTVNPPTGAISLTGQQAVVFLPGTLKPTAVSLSFSGSAPGVFTGAPILVGNPYYSVQRLRKREFIVSACTFRDFPPKDPAESVTLTFDFAVELPASITLTGLPTVSVTVTSGSDVSPGSIFNGPAGFDSGLSQVIVPVKGGLANCDYDIKVVVPTTDSLNILALSGILPVRA